MTLAEFDAATLLSLAVSIVAICIAVWTGQNAKAASSRANEISKDANAIAKEALEAATGLHVLLTLECRVGHYSADQPVPILTVVNRSAFPVAIERIDILVGSKVVPAHWIKLSHHPTSMPFELEPMRLAYVEWPSSWINDREQDLSGKASLTLWTESRHRFDVDPAEVRRVLDQAIAARR